MKKLAPILFLTLCILLLTAPLAQALEIQLYYTNMAKLTAILSISSGGTATCTGKVLPSGTNVKTSKVTLRLQQKDGNNWIALKTWNVEGSGLAGASCSETKSVAHGTYRVKVTGRVYDATGALLESATKYSAEVIY